MTEVKEMKGIILAGGTGSRLYPLTQITSKQLLPVYKFNMIFYPLNVLIKAGIKKVMIIVTPQHANDFATLLGDGSKFGIDITYRIQLKPKGLADAFILGADFIGNDNVTLILGDNIFEDNVSADIKSFKSGGRVFVTSVNNPERFGVMKLNEDEKPVEIVEKPQKWISNLAITGLYVFDASVIPVAQGLKPSERGEIEITDLQRHFLNQGQLSFKEFEGKWFDTGNQDALLDAGIWAREKMPKNWWCNELIKYHESLHS